MVHLGRYMYKLCRDCSPNYDMEFPKKECIDVMHCSHYDAVKMCASTCYYYYVKHNRVNLCYFYVAVVWLLG